MITIEDLTFRYRKGDFRLRIPRLSVAEGESLAIVGPSGSGKTTLLNLIAGILAPESGRVSVQHNDLGRLDDAGRRVFRIRQLGLVFQEFHLFPHLSVMQNLTLAPMQEENADKAAVEGNCRALHKKVGLREKEKS